MSSIFAKSLFLGKGEAFWRVQGRKRRPLGGGPLRRGTSQKGYGHGEEEFKTKRRVTAYLGAKGRRSSS